MCNKVEGCIPHNNDHEQTIQSTGTLQPHSERTLRRRYLFAHVECLRDIKEELEAYHGVKLQKASTDAYLLFLCKNGVSNAQGSKKGVLQAKMLDGEQSDKMEDEDKSG